MRRRRRLWIWAVVLVIVAAGGYMGWRWAHSNAALEADTPTLQTSVARRGEIVLSATGVGTLIPVSKQSLSFPVAGTLLTLEVQVGDRVQAGQPVASIDDTEARLALSKAEIQFVQAQQALANAESAHEELLAGPSETQLAAAHLAVLNAEDRLTELSAGPTEVDLAAAQANVAVAQARYEDLKAQPDPVAVEKAKLSLDRAKNSLWSAQMNRDAACGSDHKGSACDQAQASVLNAEISVQMAEMEYEAALEPATDAELASAWSQVLQAQEALAELQEDPTETEILAAETELANALEALEELESSPTDEEIAASELAVQQVEVALAQAERDLAEAQEAFGQTTLVSPYDGVVTAVLGSVGDEIKAEEAVVTVADQSRYVLEIMVDESDMATLSVGREVEVVFDALPDQTFTGHVTQVDPALTSSVGLSFLSGTVELDAGSVAKPQGMPLGLAATVDVIGGRTENAVLVPVEALREIEPGSYGVFVMENGEPRLHMVEVGLMDLTYAEIISGVQEGDVVSTGMVATK